MLGITKKRTAFIGLSSPTAYYYDHKKEYFKDNKWDWMPIIESPQGLMTLFDEIWFLHPCLCPLTMRKLDFVRFIVKDSELLKISKDTINDIENKDLVDIVNNSSFLELDIDKNYSADFCNYNNIIKGVFGVENSREVPIDNHSHMFDLDGIRIYSDSTDLKKIIIDVMLARKFQKIKHKKIELITNTFSEPAVSKGKINIDEMKISQCITLSRVPVLQHPYGPEINGIEKIRENKFLVEFREKMDSIINEYPTEETQEIIMRIEEEYKKYTLESLVKKQSSTKIFNSVVKSLALSLIDSFVPGSTTIKEQLENKRVREMNWTAFLATLDLKK